MTEDKDFSSHGMRRRGGMREGGMLSGVYGMALIGGAVYYIEHAVTFWGGVIGVLKALVWPAVLMYKILELLK